MATAKQIAKMDYRAISQMSTEDLYKAARVLQKAANQNIDRLERAKRPVYSPALENLKESRGKDYKFSLRGKSPNVPNARNALMKEFFAAYNFLNSKTGTVMGARRYKKEVEQRIGFGRKLTDEEMKVFWKLYDKTSELGNLLAYGSDRAQQIVDEFTKGLYDDQQDTEEGENGEGRFKFSLLDLYSDDKDILKSNIERAALELNGQLLRDPSLFKK